MLVLRGVQHPNAGYEICMALLTILLREDNFCNGSFMRQYEAVQVNMILDRMLGLLKWQGRNHI